MSHAVQHFLAKHNIPQLQHPPYSPDMAPCDFFLFPKIKNQLKGRSFQDIEEIKENATRELKALTEDDLKTCFEQSQKPKYIKKLYRNEIKIVTLVGNGPISLKISSITCFS